MYALTIIKISNQLPFVQTDIYIHILTDKEK